MPLMISLKIVEKEIDGNARTRRSQEQSQTVQNAKIRRQHWWETGNVRSGRLA